MASFSVQIIAFWVKLMGMLSTKDSLYKEFARSGSVCSGAESVNVSPSPEKMRASLCSSLEPHRDKFAILTGGSLHIIKQSPRELFRDLERGIKMGTSSAGLRTGAELGW